MPGKILELVEIVKELRGQGEKSGHMVQFCENSETIKTDCDGTWFSGTPDLR